MRKNVLDLGKILENPMSPGPGTNIKRECSTRLGNSLIISPKALNNLRNSVDDFVPPDKKFPIRMKQIGGTSL